jgi:hypothetical protein
MKILRVGAFILLVCGAVAVAEAASDVGTYYWVFKRAEYNQTSTANPVVAGAPFHFHSLVERTAGGSFSGGTSTLALPLGSVVASPQSYSANSDGSLQYDAYLGSQSDLDKAFASGSYNLNIRGATTDYFSTVRLVGATSFPPQIPKVSNTAFKNGQLVVKPTQAFTLTWNSFASHDADDVIVLSIVQGTNIVSRTVLPGSATSKAFAANFFKAEQTYIADLSFVKVVDRNTTDIPGSTGLGGYATNTRVYLSTSSLNPINGLANISTRGFVGTGDNVLISGFIVVSPDSSKVRVIVRALGPSLTGQGVVGALQDPTIDLLDKDHHLIGSNDSWRTTASLGFINTYHLAPSDNRESALVRDLLPGDYTAIVRGKNGTTGIGLTEVYNVGSSGNGKLANIATRGQVLTDDKVMICGLIIGGPSNHSILFRALGPSLSPGVAGVLADPVMQVINAQGQTLASNDNWRDTQQTDIQATGLAPSNNMESAVLRTLGPGLYTAIVRGRQHTVGIALAEIYSLN